MWFLIISLLLTQLTLAEIVIRDVDKLVNRLTYDAIDQSDTYAHALTIIESYRSAPSCHRLAAGDLVQACEAIETDSNAETMIQETKELFAVRLAMCELDTAQVSTHIVPSACKGFYSTACAQGSNSWTKVFQRTESQVTSGDKLCFPAVSRKQVRSCVGALQGQPQSWTSYSNALQNVGVVCQATRNAREKDELLNVHKKLVHTNQGLQKAYEAALQHGMQFTQAARDVQVNFMDEARRGVHVLREDAAQAGRDLKDLFGSFSEEFFLKGQDLSAALEAWNKQAAAASGSASDITLNLAVADQHALALSRNMQVVSFHVVDLQGVLADMLEKVDQTNEQMQTVVAMHETVTNSLTNSTAEIEKIVAKHNQATSYAIDFRTVAILMGVTVLATQYSPLIATRVVLPLCTAIFLAIEAYTWVLRIDILDAMRLLHLA